MEESKLNQAPTAPGSPVEQAPPPTPGGKKKPKVILIVAAAIFALLLAGMVFAVLTNMTSLLPLSKNIKPTRMDVCKQDTKACPDGSSVKRLGPSCNFEKCASTNNPKPTSPAATTPTCSPKPACVDSSPPCDIPPPVGGWCNN